MADDSPDSWQFWHSDDRERWHGPFESRSLAVAAGSSFHSGPFHVCEAFKFDHRHMTISGFDILESLAERYEELGDPDGDELFQIDAADSATVNILGQRMTEVFHAWVEEFKIDTGIHSFELSRNEEWVLPASDPDP